ncbi:dipeptidase [Parolsenella catena]|uniref:dipeptidase n=1 Tax=Parolsenella catena TaxID=2003188 RepID=UPI003A921658
MSYPVFDMHCDTADRLAWQFLPDDIKQTCGMDFYGPGDADDPSACRDLASSHCHISLDKVGATPWAQCFACYVPDTLSPEQATGFHEGVMSHLAHEVERNAGRVVAVASASQLRDVLENSGEPHVAAVHTIENARMFAADLGLVERYAADGLLMASISWNAAGPLASGHDTHEHVSELGARAIAEMERNRVVLDVSHLNDECFDDVCRLSTRPFVASHSNSRAVCGHRRNLTDRQFAEIRERGGVVGLNYCDKFLSNEVLEGRAADVSFDEVAAHIEHWLDLGGEDVVALGGDLDGATVPSLLDGADKMPAFQGLLERRFGSTITRKLCYANALAFFEREGR